MVYSVISEAKVVRLKPFTHCLFLYVVRLVLVKSDPVPHSTRANQARAFVERWQKLSRTTTCLSTTRSLPG
jgi:hypothetical protein